MGRYGPTGPVSPISPISEKGTMSARIPMATYRLQFNHLFTLNQASAILDYLRGLGISDCYASPLFMARPGSLHGYDVIDPTKLNPELGRAKISVNSRRS